MEEVQKKFSFTILVVAIVFTVAFIAAGLFLLRTHLMNQNTSVDYTLSDVPYYGIYNSFFHADSLTATTIYSVLRYWGDQRFSLTDLKTKFGSTQDSLQEAKAFFEENGYRVVGEITSDKSSGDQEQLLGLIRKYVNSKKQTPVIVFQHRSINDLSISGPRLVIGISDTKKEITVHDHDFGNYYVISFADFAKMSQGKTEALVVQPDKNIQSTLKKTTSENQPYKKRYAGMSETGTLFMYGANAELALRQQNFTEAASLLEKLISDDRFNNLPPAVQVKIYSNYARVLFWEGEFDKSIDILLSKAIPLNNDLDQPYEGWTAQEEVFKVYPHNEASFTAPYTVLANDYIAQEKYTDAKQALTKALEIWPGDSYARGLLQPLLSN